MADRELIAAILTVGMLPTIPVRRSRARGRSGPVTDVEGDAMNRREGHALGFFRSLLEGLGVDPFANLRGDAAAVSGPNKKPASVVTLRRSAR